MAVATRLPWYGREQPKRFARIQPRHTGGLAYSWSVHYDGQAISALVDDKQHASDAANEAWPRVIEMARKAAARAEWERHTLEMIEKAKRGEVDPHYFANKAAEYENMMWVMDRIKPRPGMANTLSVGLQRVVDALSAEFHRRRPGN
jgi:hypothetical protein